MKRSQASGNKRRSRNSCGQENMERRRESSYESNKAWNEQEKKNVELLLGNLVLNFQAFVPRIKNGIKLILQKKFQKIKCL